MKTKSPLLVNAEEMARQYPETFGVPVKRAELLAGWFAKVSCNSERFWVIIRECNDGVYVGQVNNMLLCQPKRGIKIGDMISFAPCNVYQAADADGNIVE